MPSYQTRLDGSLIISSVQADHLLYAADFSMPYGGIDWVQREGFTIRSTAKRSVERIINECVESWD